MGRFWSLQGNSIHLVLHVHPKCKRLALTYSRVHGQLFMNMVEKVFLDGCFREHVVLGWNVRDHLCTFLSSESDNELYEYMTEAFEFSFAATDCSHPSQGSMWALERHVGFTGLVEVRQQDIDGWKRDAKSPYRFKCTHCSWNVSNEYSVSLEYWPKEIFIIKQIISWKLGHIVDLYLKLCRISLFRWSNRLKTTSNCSANGTVTTE